MNYYEECFQKIEKLIQEEHYQEAMIKIKEELSMPYVPMDVEERLNEYWQQCPPSSTSHQCNDEQIEEWLLLDEAHQLLAIQALSKRNLRQFWPVVSHVLETSTSILTRIALLEQCILQQIQEECHMKVNGLEYEFIPAYLELPEESDGVIQAMQYFEAWLANDNPSLLNLCQQSLMKEAYLRLPLSIDEDESEPIAIAILTYVSQLMGCENEVNDLLFEKNVAQMGHLDLLLYSNPL